PRRYYQANAWHTGSGGRELILVTLQPIAEGRKPTAQIKRHPVTTQPRPGVKGNAWQPGLSECDGQQSDQAAHKKRNERRTQSGHDRESPDWPMDDPPLGTPARTTARDGEMRWAAYSSCPAGEGSRSGL